MKDFCYIALGDSIALVQHHLLERNGRVPYPDASGTAAAVWADCLPKFRPQWRPGG